MSMSIWPKSQLIDFPCHNKINNVATGSLCASKSLHGLCPMGSIPGALFRGLCPGGCVPWALFCGLCPGGSVSVPGGSISGGSVPRAPSRGQSSYLTLNLPLLCRMVTV